MMEGGVPDILTRLFWPAGSTHTHLIQSKGKNPFKSPIPPTETHTLFEGLTHSSYATGLPLSQAQRNAGRWTHTVSRLSPPLVLSPPLTSFQSVPGPSVRVRESLAAQPAGLQTHFHSRENNTKLWPTSLIVRHMAQFHAYQCHFSITDFHLESFLSAALKFYYKRCVFPVRTILDGGAFIKSEAKQALKAKLVLSER